MGFSLGIVGLPNVGKSTLFNAITRNNVEASNYPFCTIDPNVGIVPVPDKRLSELTKLSSSIKTVPTTIEFVDIAGLVKGASKGEGLGNQFLANIREVSAIVHVVRCFEDENIVHVHGTVDPKQDIEVINYELILADLSALERKIGNLSKKAKGQDDESNQMLAFCEKVKAALEEGLPARSVPENEQEYLLLRDLFLLSSKPVIYVANVSEEEVANPMKNQHLITVKDIASREGAKVVAISSKIESEISQLPPDEAKAFLAEYGLHESGLDLLAKEGYDLLGLITFLTTGATESRAWTIRKGTKAPQAAGVIHTDFEKGFIKAEIVSYSHLIKAGGYSKARELGQVRLEGKDYIMQDGDVVEFKFA